MGVVGGGEQKGNKKETRNSRQQNKMGKHVAAIKRPIKTGLLSKVPFSKGLKEVRKLARKMLEGRGSDIWL